jgi:hypothetical protein
MPDVSLDEAAVLEVAVPHCAAEDMGDEIVALNVDTGVYFSMRERAVGIWRDLAGGAPVSAIYEAANGSEAEVRRFVGQLVEHGLMREAQAKTARIDGAVATLPHPADGKIIFEVFEDMKDLILSDPLHDSDPAIGWPHKG